MNLLTCRLRNGPPNDFPIEYLADESDRPNSMELSASQWVDIPTISLAQTRFNNLYDLQRLVDDVCAASASYGMFQVVDHGVPESVLTNAMIEGVGFFQMTSQELEAFSEASEGRLYSSSKMHACGENTINFYWRDALVLGLNSPRQIQDWPVHPPLLKSRIWEFALGVNAVENKILNLINQGLGLRPNYFNHKGLNKAPQTSISYFSGPTNACVVGPAEELTRTVLPRYRKFQYGYYSWRHFKDYRTALQHFMY